MNEFTVEKLLNKRVVLHCCNDEPLIRPEPLFSDNETQQDKFQSHLKCRLNDAKSQLNDLSLDEWHRHTKAVNPAGRILWQVQNACNPELLTQAWLKFYQILETFSLFLSGGSTLSSLHLCEAPGAFIAALNHHLQNNNINVKWNWLASTLNPHYEGNPGTLMVSDDRFLIKTQKHWDFGPDSSGDILLLETGRHLSTLGPFDLVTADGSIDCQDDPGEQEATVASLLTAETTVALTALKLGGCFVLKTFTWFENSSLGLLQLLCSSFQKVSATKPVASKEGNSEVYLVCEDFKGVSEELKANLWENYGNVLGIENIPEGFLQRIREASLFFLDLQVEAIEKNLTLFSSGPSNAQKIRLRALQNAVANRYLQQFNLSGLVEDRVVPGASFTRLQPPPSPWSFAQMQRMRACLRTRNTSDAHSTLDMLLQTLKPAKLELPFILDSCPVEISVRYGRPFDQITCSKFCAPWLLQLHDFCVHFFKEKGGEVQEEEGWMQKVLQKMEGLQSGQNMRLSQYKLFSYLRIGVLRLLCGQFNRTELVDVDLQGCTFVFCNFKGVQADVEAVLNLEMHKESMQLLEVVPITSIVEWVPAVAANEQTVLRLAQATLALLPESRVLLLFLWLLGSALAPQPRPRHLPPFLHRLFSGTEARSDPLPFAPGTDAPPEPEWVPLAPIAVTPLPTTPVTPSFTTPAPSNWLPVECLPANDTQPRLPSKEILAEDDEDEASEWTLVQAPIVQKVPWDSQVAPKFAHRPGGNSPSRDWLSTPDEVRPEPEPEPLPEPEPAPEPEPHPEPEPSGFPQPILVVKEASEFGVEQMLLLYNVTEPQLFKDGLTLPKKSPGALVASFNQQPGRALPLARYAHATLHASEHLRASLFRLSGIGQQANPDNSLLRECPLRKTDFPCSRTPQRYRSADGRCNNPRFPTRGAPLMPYRRLLPAAYNDGIQEVRRSITGAELPSARTVSVAVLRDPGDKRVVDADSKASHLLMQWGQFLDHDLTATPQSHGFNGSVPQCCKPDHSGELPPGKRHPECMPIPVDPADPHFSKRGVRCLHFMRSAPAPREDCGFGARQQANGVTAFLDGSTVYGSWEDRQLELRLFHHGQLNIMPGKKNKPLLPPAPPDEQVVCRASKRHPCLKAGDLRANEQPGLTSMHILFLREHNRIAKLLHALNPGWSDEQLFQETRRIVVAEIQHITLHEFLPVILGPEVYKVFEFNETHPGYDENADPTIPNSFAAAAYRFGHMLVQDKIWRCNALHQRLQHNKTLHQELAVPGIVLAANTPERLLIGMSRQLARNVDHTISRELTDHLFETPEFNPGLDLAAMNIQRGRDHGLRPYNSWREPCGLRKIDKWEDLTYVVTPRYAALLPQLYNHVDDIDLFVGGMGEKPVPGGLVGPTFACIIGQTFADLRVGDRLWYEALSEMSSFTQKQLEQIKKANLARMMCDNLEGVITVTKFPMRAHNTQNNSYVQCTQKKKMKEIDLSHWRELVPGDPDSPIIEQPQKPRRTTPKPPRRRPGLAQMLLNRLIPSRRQQQQQPAQNKQNGNGLLDRLQVDTYVLRAKRFDKDQPWPEVEIPKPNFR